MDWKKISSHPIDDSRIHFLTDGNVIFMKGSTLHNFLFQLRGEQRILAEFEPTHWVAMPDITDIKIEKNE